MAAHPPPILNIAPDSVLLYEPSRPKNYFPFSVMHPLWELRCGVLRLYEKAQKLFPDSRLLYYGRTLQLRSFLARCKHDPQNVLAEHVLTLRADILLDNTLVEALNTYAASADYHEDTDTPCLLTRDGEHIGAYIPKKAFLGLSDEAPELDTLCDLDEPLYRNARRYELHPQPRSIQYLWDAIAFNAAAIESDVSSSYVADHNAAAFPQLTHTIDAGNIYCGENVDIGPFCTFDASKGPIVIGHGVRIEPHCTFFGPCAIGRNSVVKSGSRIYGGVSIGERCKMAGEISNTIVQAYANKQHDGFIGDSFLGEWVNLGAGTNTSNLKNNYGRIRIRIDDDEYHTGRTFLGLLCGDHTKCGINTMFNTGTVIGISANIFGGDYPEKFIPSFSWGGRVKSPAFSISKAIQVARTVMQRRERTLTKEEELVLRKEFERVTPYY